LEFTQYDRIKEYLPNGFHECDRNVSILKKFSAKYFATKLLFSPSFPNENFLGQTFIHHLIGSCESQGAY
jgi:hypothetical protein